MSGAGWWDALWGLIFPARCAECRTEVAKRGDWCAPCLAKVKRLRSFGGSVRGVRMCTALAAYRGGVKRVLRDMKFRGRRTEAEALRRLVREFDRDLLIGKADVIVPIPISEKKRQMRGFNQTEEIFGAWAEGSSAEWMPDVLMRVRDTESQWRLSKRERLANLKDAFAVNDAEVVMGKRVLLVDDIYTTGATLDICARLLKKAGAAEVYALVLASEHTE